MGVVEQLHGRELGLRALLRGDDAVTLSDDPEDAIFTTTSSSSLFETPSLYGFPEGLLLRRFLRAFRLARPRPRLLGMLVLVDGFQGVLQVSTLVALVFVFRRLRI